jgi:hypothetical protein
LRSSRSAGGVGSMRSDSGACRAGANTQLETKPLVRSPQRPELCRQERVGPSPKAIAQMAFNDLARPVCRLSLVRCKPARTPYQTAWGRLSIFALPAAHLTHDVELGSRINPGRRRLPTVAIAVS